MSTKLLDALVQYRLATTATPGYALLETGTDVNSDVRAATASAVYRVQNDTNTRVLRAGDTMEGELNMGGHALTGATAVSATGTLNLRTGGADRIRVLSTGQVGIGTDYTPSTSYRLDVQGKLFVSDDILLSSDERFKTDVRSISNALEKVTTMRGVTYRSTTDPDQKIRMGLIAQELERVAPEVVNTDANTGYKSVAYGNLVGILVQAVKELSDQLSEAKTDVKELNDAVKELEEKVAALERRNEPPA